MKRGQLSLFEQEPGRPEGLTYRPDVLSPEEETALVGQIADLPFKPFEFHGFLGARRVVSFGWRYDFAEQGLHAAPAMPDFLLPLRERAAGLAGLAAEDLQHALVTEYAPAAGIGWHRDRPVFGEVIGISLLSPCTLRFRRRQGDRWERAALKAEPRSAYVLKGPAREDWQHSILRVDALRYSVTFRAFRSR